MSEQLYTMKDLNTFVTHFTQSGEEKWLSMENTTLWFFIHYTTYPAAKMPDGRVWDRTLQGFRS